MKKRYALILAYDGANYCGWQIQPGVETVQGTLESALSTILRQEVAVTGCGRTDTGVHASYYVSHIEAELNRSVADLHYHLNNYLPADIAIIDMQEVSSDFHARFNAVEREYQYFIQLEKNPFMHRYAAFSHQKLDVEKMNEAAKKLLIAEEFGAFCKAGSQNQTNICDVRLAEWEVNESQLTFTISANRFLRNMVRAIVGTLIEVGRGKLTVTDFEEIIDSQDRTKAGFSAPAKGLFLTDVKYGSDQLDTTNYKPVKLGLNGK
jgi:tRNA pseudouridine38-40 synthase